MFRGYDAQRSKDWKIITPFLDKLTGRIDNKKIMSLNSLEKQIDKLKDYRIVINYTTFASSEAIPINKFGTAELKNAEPGILREMLSNLENKVYDEPLISKSDEYDFYIITRRGISGEWLNIIPYRNGEKIPMRIDIFETKYRNPIGITPSL